VRFYPKHLISVAFSIKKNPRGLAKGIFFGKTYKNYNTADFTVLIMRAATL
jgi:hypothetical protein